MVTSTCQWNKWLYFSNPDLRNPDIKELDMRDLDARDLDLDARDFTELKIEMIVFHLEISKDGK